MLARTIQVATHIDGAMEGVKAVTASASSAPTPDNKKTKYTRKYKPIGTGSPKSKTADGAKQKHYCYRCVLVGITHTTINVWL